MYGAQPVTLDDILQLLGLTDKNEKPRGKTFFQELTGFAARENMTDSQLYNAVGMHRTRFYVLRDKKDASVKKKLCLKLCIVLRLSVYETIYLMALAKHSFSPGVDRTDEIVNHCLQSGIYSPEKIDELLYDNGLETLFSEYE